MVAPAGIGILAEAVCGSIRGAEIAGFTIERTLGDGGMGIVHLARNPRLNRLAALKVLGGQCRDVDFGRLFHAPHP